MFTKTVFRSAYGYDVEKASDDSAVFIEGPSLTVQSQAEDADINVMMYRYGITGKMPENPRVPTYGDFTGISDYQSALHAVMYADDAFMELPANVRARFENDPQKLLDFVANGANVDEARKLGLLKEQVNVGESGANVGAAPRAPAKGVGADPVGT